MEKSVTNMLWSGIILHTLLRTPPIRNIKTQRTTLLGCLIFVIDNIFIRPYYGMALSICLSVRPSVCPSVRSVVHNPCGQDIAKTIWPRMLKLSGYTLYGQRKKPIYFQGQRSNVKVTGPLQRILALGSLWAGYSKN